MENKEIWERELLRSLKEVGITNCVPRMSAEEQKKVLQGAFLGDSDDAIGQAVAKLNVENLKTLIYRCRLEKGRQERAWQKANGRGNGRVEMPFRRL